MNVQEWGCFSIFWRADDVTRTMPKGGGGACECLHPLQEIGKGGMSCAAPGPALALDATAHRQGYNISRLADRSLAN